MSEGQDLKDVDFNEFCVLQSNDQPPVEFKVRREAAMMSGLVKDMLEDQGDSEPIIPIPNVSARTLKLVIDYMEHHYNNRADPIEKPLKSSIDKIISEWDHKFLYTNLVKDNDEKQHEVLIDVIMAANFLNVRDLLDLTCACVANMIRGKSAEEIRALFNIESDFTPEEEEKIREENRWCEEA
uniref:Uncharacterized protein TCIL3000_11_6650 n=1 Tax=Trypanosoma congolense (strain IL3000) TaxID=1068625 RepID=G0V0S0_TRYCI|nr:unnamed protein product [Trypanosoma congolense IL3000]CCC95241.1 unnamed protein product [Trypanosoma congolense IL3000]